VSSTNWTDVAASPELNYTNLNWEVSVPAPTGKGFYRLALRDR